VSIVHRPKVLYNISVTIWTYQWEFLFFYVVTTVLEWSVPLFTAIFFSSTPDHSLRLSTTRRRNHNNNTPIVRCVARVSCTVHIIPTTFRRETCVSGQVYSRCTVLDFCWRSTTTVFHILTFPVRSNNDGRQGQGQRRGGSDDRRRGGGDQVQNGRGDRQP